MKRILKVNVFFLVLILLHIVEPYVLLPMKKALHISRIDQLLVLHQFTFLIVPVIVYIIITRQSFIEVLRIKKISFKNIGYVIIISFLAIPIMLFLGQVTNLFFRNNISDLIGSMRTLSLWQLIAVIAMLPAFCEELTMRGVVLSGFKKMSMTKAAVLSGFLFGVLHMNPCQFLYTFALGVILAYLVNITKSIFASMIVHFIFNGFSAVLSWMSFRMGGKEQSSVAVSQSLMINMLITFFVLAVICSISIYVLVVKMKKYNESISEEQVKQVAYNRDMNNDRISKALAYSPIFMSVIIYIISSVKTMYPLGMVDLIIIVIMTMYVLYCIARIKMADVC